MLRHYNAMIKSHGSSLRTKKQKLSPILTGFIEVVYNIILKLQHLIEFVFSKNEFNIKVN